MSNQQAQVLLMQLGQMLRQHQLWDENAPTTQALSSSVPFAADTLSCTQWLQWIFIPRMTVLLEQGGALPHGFEITPYVEETMRNDTSCDDIVVITRQLDQLFGGKGQ
ncbi:YqcC family protein [Thaumasiovibrio sp. DFM-14]|uniref:YqcC family protein n=1 Tax=Thaumasiovibrio sp. DFM-14 TaxID=3384792 RepID=UPI0039A3651F